MFPVIIGFPYYLPGKAGKAEMQAIALDVFLAHDGVNTVVFQGTAYGKHNRTFVVKR